MKTCTDVEIHFLDKEKLCFTMMGQPSWYFDGLPAGAKRPDWLWDSPASYTVITGGCFPGGRAAGA
jgi:hypothetical protein